MPSPPALCWPVSPPGRRPRRLVGGGFNLRRTRPVREIIAAFEQKTGNRWNSSSSPQDELLPKILAALEAGHPPDFMYTLRFDDHLPRWAQEGRLVDLATRSARLRPVDQDRSSPPLARLDDRPAQPPSAADGLYGNHLTSGEPPRAGPASGSRHPEQGSRSGVLVRHGPARPAQATGRDDVYGIVLANVGGRERYESRVPQFMYAYAADYVTRDGSSSSTSRLSRTGWSFARQLYGIYRRAAPARRG